MTIHHERWGDYRGGPKGIRRTLLRTFPGGVMVTLDGSTNPAALRLAASLLTSSFAFAAAGTD